jgi:hypothetical protein
MNISASLKRASSLGLISLGIASSPTVLAATDNGSLTIGRVEDNICWLGGPVYSGYNAGAVPYGSYSPTGLTGGKTVIGISELTVCGAATGLGISGFSADPGSNWLTSITCNGATLVPGAPGFSYSYNSGTANWMWLTVPFGFAGKSVGSVVGCSITHN